MKLNLVQDFPTGIYDYNLLTSAFVALAPVNARPAGSPTKVSFSAQEWCGHVYTQVLFDARYARFATHSYFDTEADSAASLEMPSDVLSEDALLIWARGFSPPVLAPGESADRPLLGSLRHARLLHEPLVVTPAHFTRAAAGGAGVRAQPAANSAASSSAPRALTSGAPLPRARTRGR